MDNVEIEAITIIGSGNVATHLATAFYRSGINIEGIYSRNAQNANALASKIEARVLSDVSEINDNSDIILLAVPDIAISDVARRVKDKDSLVAHVSGSTSMEVLQPFFSNFGVFYPLQTFTKSRVIDYAEIPVCIEASNKSNTEKLMRLARSFSHDVRVTNSHERLVIHLSAVYASNYVNFMNVIAADILQRENISRDILFPLIRETMEKLIEDDPKHVQTGPAVRGDHGTLQKHVEVLSTDPEIQKIYRILSEEILKYFKH